MQHAIKPSDLLADGVDSLEVNGVEVRKGSVGAFLANLALYEDADASSLEKLAALQMIENLVPVLKALRIHQHVTWNNPKIEALFS